MQQLFHLRQPGGGPAQMALRDLDLSRRELASTSPQQTYRGGLDALRLLPALLRIAHLREEQARQRCWSCVARCLPR